MQNSPGPLQNSSDKLDSESGNSSRAIYAEVAVPLHISHTFTYRLPARQQPLAQIGSRIVVPLGRKLVTGYIVDLTTHLKVNSLPGVSEIKEAEEILDLEPVLTPELIHITRWISEYYAAPWGEVIKSALPPGISPPIEQLVSITEEGRTKIEPPLTTLTPTTKTRILNLLLEGGPTRLEEIAKVLGPKTPMKALRELEKEGWVSRIQRPGALFVKPKYQRMVKLLAGSEADKRRSVEPQRRILNILMEQNVVSLKDLLTLANASLSSVYTLQRHGLVEIFDQDLRRDPLAGVTLPQVMPYPLTEAQTRVLSEIERALREGKYAPFLLHGVTGSGKTEVYIRAMRLALLLGRSAIMLVPEIALTPVFSRRLRAHFGNKVAIFHSSLSRGQRFDEWMRVRNGAARVVIGTRSAVFAPVQNLGLFIVDEEHESTYRQQESPQYHGRDTAIVRGQKESAVVLLGSATPSLESFHNARTGKYSYLNLPQRIGNRPMATARIVDMRQVFDRHKKPRVFSDELLEAIQQTHNRGEQSIILLNRRGYSSFVLCRSCGETIRCPNCDVTLTFHRSDNVIICHYCNHREPAPRRCPNCQGKYIYYVGEGTEQLEEMLRQKFPDLLIARIDRDTTSRRSLFEKSLINFSEGKIDMLVGTQMLAKGHDFPNVTLVGVVSVDAGLALPDFRAAERTFQLLTQVAGRAGRGDLPGQVLIQTYHPGHYALRHACAQDYLGFYSEETRHRQNHSYPPFISLASFLVHCKELPVARTLALELRKDLDLANEERLVRILGPAPAPITRLKGEHRIQILLKARNRRVLRRLIDTALQKLAERGSNLRSVNLEIDPVSLM